MTHLLIDCDYQPNVDHQLADAIEKHSRDKPLEQLLVLRLPKSGFWWTSPLLGSLVCLELSDNHLWGVDDVLSNLTNLQTLVLARNRLPCIKSSVEKLTQLTHLNVSENKLDDLPVHLWDLPKLTTVKAANNRLTCLRFSSAGAPLLRKLDVSHNHLTVLPCSLGHSRELRKLDVSHNELTALPGVLSQCYALKTLNAGDNRLSTLPSSLSNLFQLENLYMSGNLLEQVPDCVVHLGTRARLSYVNLSLNRLRQLPLALLHCHFEWFKMTMNPIEQMSIRLMSERWTRELECDNDFGGTELTVCAVADESVANRIQLTSKTWAHTRLQ